MEKLSWILWVGHVGKRVLSLICEARESELYTEGNGMTETERETFEDAAMLALKMKEGTILQRIPMAITSWKRQGNSFFHRASRRNTALPTL